MTLDPELCPLVFLPPLLLLEGWRIPKNALLKDWNVAVDLRAERDEIFRLARAGTIGSETARRLIWEKDRLESRFTR